jgi:hypothetical protein
MLKLLNGLLILVLLFFFVLVYHINFDGSSGFEDKPSNIIVNQEPNNTIENGIHVASGLKAGDALQLVISNCTACHSSKLITQNRASKEGWLSMIHWMQETQNLWSLGENEKPILEYLSKHYAPEKKGRRQQLENIEWYDLEL